eukprot:205661_1
MTTTVLTASSVGIWTDEKKCVEMFYFPGILNQSLGFSCDGKTWLYPEEVLYMLERGQLEVLYLERSISKEQFYSLAFSSNCYSESDSSLDLSVYFAFLELKRQGCHCMRTSRINRSFWMNLDSNASTASNQLSPLLPQFALPQSFYVWSPSQIKETKFRKSNPPLPDFVLFICRPSLRPKLSDIPLLTKTYAPIQVCFAVVEVSKCVIFRLGCLEPIGLNIKAKNLTIN